jgi:hypothetical protein
MAGIMEKLSAIISGASAWIAFITLKDVQVYTTILAAFIAIISGCISIYLNIKKIK